MAVPQSERLRSAGIRTDGSVTIDFSVPAERSVVLLNLASARKSNTRLRFPGRSWIKLKYK